MCAECDYSSTFTAFQRPTAMMAPTNGPAMNTHTFARASPPAKIAGPIERAGFTDVPVKCMPTRWMRMSDRPIASPAKLFVAPFVLLVAPSTTNTNRAVSTASTMRPVTAQPSQPAKPFAPQPSDHTRTAQQPPQPTPQKTTEAAPATPKQPSHRPASSPPHTAPQSPEPHSPSHSKIPA